MPKAELSMILNYSKFTKQLILLQFVVSLKEWYELGNQ
jgi:hypothetical protein